MIRSASIVLPTPNVKFTRDIRLDKVTVRHARIFNNRVVKRYNQLVLRDNYHRKLGWWIRD
jgi:hypothetical protein